MNKKLSIEIIEQLRKIITNPVCELDFSNNFELLCAVMLSAQTTDKRVNLVTKELFCKFPTPKALMQANYDDVYSIISSVGLAKTKTINLIKLAKVIHLQFHDQVPNDFESLVSIPGVGRKTANVVISNCFGVQAFAVDVHVFRVSNRIGLANASTPEKTELDLMKNIDENLWTICHHTIIFHGRRCCTARNPKCEECTIKDYCKYYKNKDL